MITSYRFKTFSSFEPLSYLFQNCSSLFDAMYDVICTVDKLCLHTRKNKRIYAYHEIILCLIDLKNFFWPLLPFFGRVWLYLDVYSLWPLVFLIRTE